MNKFAFVAFIVVFGWILAACATPPTEDMNRAHDAVIRAENDADAVAYAPAEIIRAREALSRMQSEADAKRYDAARNFAAEAIAYAERAIDEGWAGATRARSEAAALLNGLETPLSETRTAISSARQVDNINLDFDTLSRDMGTAGQTYDSARQSLNDNNYRDAIAGGHSVRSMLSDINSTINYAVQDAARKR